MAKQSFKDMIFKLLKKDENLGAYGGVKQNKPKSFKVKFAMKDRPNNIAVMSYQFEKDAEKFKKDILAKGGKAILTKEDFSVNEKWPPDELEGPSDRRSIGKRGKMMKKISTHLYDLRSKGKLSNPHPLKLNDLATTGDIMGFYKYTQNLDSGTKDEVIGAFGKAAKEYFGNKGVEYTKKLFKVARLNMGEDAPANATGTAVVGTGDDSSTVVVKKKKRLQDKLMRRMGIQETIDRVIPDLEYPKDEIRERVNQLKAAALGEATPDPITYGPDKVAKAMAIAVKSDGQFSKAVREIEKIGKDLSKVSTIARALKTANEELSEAFTFKNSQKDIEKVFYKGKEIGNVMHVNLGGKMFWSADILGKAKKMGHVSKTDAAKELLKSKNESVSEGAAVPKDKDTDQPKKYVSGLSDKDKKAHDKHLEKGSKKSDSDKSAYKQSPADKKAKTKPSVHTKKFKQMYGEDYLNEKIKGLENKAEKSGMPYSILKKVYDRGMAAWKGGHRPGTTPQQWAFARVNSFTTKSSGTWGKADSDLAKQVRGS